MDLITPSMLFFGLVFGAIGLGYFMYGKKQGAMVPLVCGVLLMIIPYFISSTAVLVIVGVVLSAVPFFLKL